MVGQVSNLSVYLKDSQMRNTKTAIVLSIAFVCLVSVPDVFAQTSNPSPRRQSNQEQMIQDLLNEVRELRTIVQRIDSNSVRTRITLDRLRAHQEQLLSLTRDIFDVREKIVETRTRQQQLKEKISELEKGFQAGLKSKEEHDEAIAGMEGLKQREANLIERETQLTADIDAAKASLIDLNNRLDVLERESTAPTENNLKSPVKKQQ